MLLLFDGMFEDLKESLLDLILDTHPDTEVIPRLSKRAINTFMKKIEVVNDTINSWPPDYPDRIHPLMRLPPYHYLFYINHAYKMIDVRRHPAFSPSDRWLANKLQKEKS